MITEGDVLDIKRGDDEQYLLTFRKTPVPPAVVGDAQPLSGCTVWLTIKPKAVAYPASDPDDTTAILKLTWQHDGTSVTESSGIAIPDGGEPDDGLLIASIDHDTTAALRGGLIGRYDVQIKFPGDVFKTWAEGPVKVSLDVTERETVP